MDSDAIVCNNSWYLLLQHGVGVEFIRILPETHTPQLTNLFCECAPNDDVTELTPFQTHSFTEKSEITEDRTQDLWIGH
uniref:Uncharacterized protein n=1 Tax=Timema genevievae TaxID=629358 RepID=A0A7R9JRR9_TIMGE|nr:unnamed protein product [Timema genevievae]